MWIDKPKDEENKKQIVDTGEGPSVGAGAGGGAPQIQGSTTVATGTPSSMSPTPEAPGQKFGTIQDYFKGSKTQGEQLGQQFTSKLEDTKQKQQSAIGQAAEGAAGQVAANTIGFDQGLVSTAANDPTKIANDEDQYNKFMQQWNASYKGPESFEATDQYSNAARAAKAAQDKATQVGSTGGRQQMIQDEFGVYGAGNKGLDEALLQQSSSFGKIGERAKELNSLQDYLKSKSQDIQGKTQEAKATTEQTKQKAQEALLGDTGAIKQFKTDIDTRTAQEQAKASQNLKDIQSAVVSRANLSDQQLAMLGLTKQQYNDLLSKEKTAGYTNLQDYLKLQNPAAQISRESVAQTGDFAKDQALAKLTGRSNLLGQAKQAGKLLDFDKDRALQDYLDKINADQATRDATERQRKADQEAEAIERDVNKTAKREDTQNQILGSVVLPGLGLIDPALGGAVGAGVNKAIDSVPGARGTIKSVDKNVTQPVVKTVKSVIRAIRGFCFDGETMVDMINGSTKPIKDIQLNDCVKGGGDVQSIRISKTSNGTRFDYKGITVTGLHAVKEKNWVRIRDSVYARHINGDGIVYSLVTDLHRIYVNGIQFADEHETDNYETLTLNQSLAALNKSRQIVLEVVR